MHIFLFWDRDLVTFLSLRHSITLSLFFFFFFLFCVTSFQVDIFIWFCLFYTVAPSPNKYTHSFTCVTHRSSHSVFSSIRTYSFKDVFLSQLSCTTDNLGIYLPHMPHIDDFKLMSHHIIARCVSISSPPLHLILPFNVFHFRIAFSFNASLLNGDM